MLYQTSTIRPYWHDATLSAREKNMGIWWLCNCLIPASSANVHPLLVAMDASVVKIPVDRLATPPIHGPPTQVISEGGEQFIFYILFLLHFRCVSVWISVNLYDMSCRQTLFPATRFNHGLPWWLSIGHIENDAALPAEYYYENSARGSS